MLKKKVQKLEKFVFVYVQYLPMTPCCLDEIAAQNNSCVFMVRHKHGCSFKAPPPRDFTQTAGFKWVSICGSPFSSWVKFIKTTLGTFYCYSTLQQSWLKICLPIHLDCLECKCCCCCCAVIILLKHWQVYYGGVGTLNTETVFIF